MSSSDVISHLKEYDKELQEYKSTPLLYVDKYLSLFNELDAIETSEDGVQEKHKKLRELQKEFDDIEKQTKICKDENDKKTKDIGQRELSYISSALKTDNGNDKLIDVLKSGALKYKYAVNLIKNNDEIKQQIRDGKYIIARKGDYVALISTDKDFIGYKREFVKFLKQHPETKINDVILSNVPVYNNGSHILPFEKDASSLPDNALKLYFSLENKGKINFVQDARKTDLYGDVVENIMQQMIEYCNDVKAGNKVNVQTEASSYGIDSLLKGLLSAKYGDTKKCLSLKDGCLNISLIPRSLVNGIKPEDTAKKVYELYQLAIADGYDVKNENKSFVNLDVLSDDHLGRFEYHNIGSTDSFLKELGQLQAEHNNSLSTEDEQTLLVAVNEGMRPVVKKDIGMLDKSLSFLAGASKNDLFTNIDKNSNAYNGIIVNTMNDVANRIDNKDASVNKNNKDGVLHNVFNDRTSTNDPAKPMAINKTELKHV